jgi:hypothetical protein
VDTGRACCDKKPEGARKSPTAGSVQSLAYFCEGDSSAVSRWLADRFTPADDRAVRRKNGEEEDWGTGWTGDWHDPEVGDTSVLKGTFPEVVDVVRAS